MTKRRSRAVAVGVLLGAGMALAAPEAQYLTLRTPQNAYTVQVTDRALTSADIQLSHVGTEVRGRMFDQVVFLDVAADRVTGTVGNRITRLNFREKDEGVTEVQGNFLGRLTHLSLGPRAFTGYVGNCGYDLKVTPEGAYEGSRSCGGLPQRPVVLTLPQTLTQQGPAMTLLTLALMLGNG